MGCQDIGIRIFEFVAKTQFLLNLNFEFKSDANFQIRDVIFHVFGIARMKKSKNLKGISDFLIRFARFLQGNIYSFYS